MLMQVDLENQNWLEHWNSKLTLQTLWISHDLGKSSRSSDFECSKLWAYSLASSQARLTHSSSDLANRTSVKISIFSKFKSSKIKFNDSRSTHAFLDRFIQERCSLERPFNGDSCSYGLRAKFVLWPTVYVLYSGRSLGSTFSYDQQLVTYTLWT